MLDLVFLLAALLSMASALVELPKMEQLKLLYPGYVQYGGSYQDQEIAPLVGGSAETHRLIHNTAALRMSYALNRYGGRHAIGTAPVNLSSHVTDSLAGQDGQQYIFRNIAFGPFLAAKYGNPVMIKLSKENGAKIMDAFKQKQGIVRLVSYHKHVGGHIGLWDCSRFHHSRDWTTAGHLISVEFWETPDSHCPPEGTTPEPRLQASDLASVHVLYRQNQQLQNGARHHMRHHKLTKKGSLWIQ